MKTFCRFLIALGSIAILSSCHTWVYSSLQPDYQKMYVGASYQSIVKANGMPTRTASDGAGGAILAYESNTYDSKEMGYNYNAYTGTYTPGSRTTVNTAYIYFYINSRNICYDVKTNYQKKESKYSPGKTFGLISAIVAPIAALALIVGLSER